MKALLLRASLALALVGCAGLRRPPEVREVAVDMRVPRAEAIRRTLAVFREQGYRIRETPTSGTEPETEPFRHRDADAVFRASITGSGRTARVVFSGTYRTRELGGLVHGAERPVRRRDDSDDALDRELWARLDNLAIMLRRRAR
jgi:ABC-type ATPase with predicted acetyltransferase domain